jgi:hypothetical protein
MVMQKWRLEASNAYVLFGEEFTKGGPCDNPRQSLVSPSIFTITITTDGEGRFGVDILSGPNVRPSHPIRVPRTKDDVFVTDGS